MKTKRHGWFRVCPEKWIFGSTREEMTPSERAVWMDFLSLAAMNDPPGQVDFFTEKRLANKLNISTKLLRSTIEKALRYEKIELEESRLGAKKDKTKKKYDPTCDQFDSKKGKLVASRSESGIPRRTIFILKWNEYQSEYLRQKGYRNKDLEKEDEDCDEKSDEERLQNLSQEVVTQVTDRGEERREEEKRVDKIRGEEIESDSNPFDEFEPDNPIQSKDKPFNDGKKTIQSQYLSRLRDLPGYPFDEYQDNSLFLFVEGDYPGIDILAELEKKIAWWADHPDALRKDPYQQLHDWFEKEYEFQRKKAKRG